MPLASHEQVLLSECTTLTQPSVAEDTLDAWRAGVWQGTTGMRASRLCAEVFCPAGSRGPIGRLAKGQLPHVQRNVGGIVWPSGEVEPAVVRYIGGVAMEVGLCRKYLRR